MQASLSMKHPPAGDNEMTEMPSFCYEQIIDGVANCSQPQAHMVHHIYSLRTAMACREFSNILLTDCTHLASH